jgi:hypothetical protein
MHISEIFIIATDTLYTKCVRLLPILILIKHLSTEWKRPARQQRARQLKVVASCELAVQQAV